MLGQLRSQGSLLPVLRGERGGERERGREREREAQGDYKRRHGERGNQVRSLSILNLPRHEDYMLKKISLVCVTVTKLIRLNLAARGQNIEYSDA